ncbi:Amino acid/polyamine/organocation transporter, APC superfamily [Candidatus Sulfotelmatobacter sp. SbA7]|nr:Amino acid/polyamine/organocation transporter, APC superfamily [Candidatus Sulfotelmatobacter sp. SbA7]
MSSAPPKSHTPTSLPAPTHNLRRIGLVPFVAVLFAYCTGGPFGFESMISTSGPGLALTFLLVVPLLFAVPISLAAAEMATAMPVEGGFYRWSRAALGDFWGFQTGWWNWTGTFLMSASYGVAMADYLNAWIPLHSRWQHWVVAVLFLGLVALINVLGIRLVGQLTLLLLVASFIPVIAFIVLGYHQAHFNPFHPFFPAGRPWREAYGVGLSLALWSYAGYEQLSTVIEEVENPRRNFPLGLALVIPLTIATYAGTLAAGLAALGNWQVWETGYMVTAARLVGGAGLGTAMFAAAAIANFILLESTMLSVTRVPLTMAEDGYLHPSLARINHRFGTPARSILLTTAFCAGLAVFSVPQLIAVYAWSRIATSTLTLISFWQMRRKYPDLPRSFRVGGGTLGALTVMILPMLLFAWALFNSDPSTRLWGTLSLISGPVAYAWIRRHGRVAKDGA